MTTLTPEAVQALAQQAAESPAHLDPVLVQQVCREWQIGQQAAALQRCIVEAAYQDKLKAERERDAALAQQSADPPYDPSCLECRRAAGKDAAGTTWQCVGHVYRERDTLRSERDEAREALEVEKTCRDRNWNNLKWVRQALDNECRLSETLTAQRDAAKAQVQRLTSELAFVRNEAAGFNTAFSYALERVEAERDALRDAPAPTCRVCVVPVLDDAEVACTDCLDTLTAERDALREQLRLSNIDQCNAEAELSMQQQFTTSAESAFIACKAALTEARRVLREVEYVNTNTDPCGTLLMCPVCDALPGLGHTPDCALAAVLAQEEK